MTKNLAAVNDDYIELQGLDEDDLLDLLYCSSSAEQSHAASDIAKTIVRRLGYHALAITQAASYIRMQRLQLYQF